MKNKILFLTPFLIFSAVGLSACKGGDTSKRQLTFNRYITSKANALYSINQEELFTKRMDSKGKMSKETFILFFHPENTLCSCYQHSLATLQDYVSKYHINVYDITFEEILSNDNTNKHGLHFTTGDRSHVHLAIVSKGKVLDQFTYADDSPLAKTEYLKTYLEKRLTFDSHLSYVDQGYLDSLTIDTTRTDDYVVSYMRASCGDCAYSTPIIAFEKEVNKDIYFFDMDPLRTTGMQDGTYQTFKDDHFLSNMYNTDYGYANSGGVVPTLHYYNNGELTDACVIFNSSVAKKEGEEDKFIITDSYYTEERLPHLHYMDDVEVKVLLGRELDGQEDEVREAEIEYPAGSGNYYKYIDWGHDGQLKYHRPILDAFLAKYAM